ncbi:MAG: hemolysin III family protein [Kofleriaceae bacterium]
MEVRPKYRGVSHRIAFHTAIVAGTVLLAVAHGGTRLALVPYVILLAAMFGVSATLHRADWGPRMYNWLRRADHGTIFLCIAGTYTPFSLLGLGGAAGTKLCLLAWIVCGIGVVRALAWPHAPRAITATCFVAAGWVVLAYLPQFHAAVDATTFGLILIGGVAFTLGAVIYLIKWPDPAPATFGYHEVFHLVIIGACAIHFIAVARLATS